MESIGARLKKIRLERGISLEEVQKKTKIHLSILRAIEGDGLINLSPIYLKGFLKIYCKFLGVDPREHIPDYKETQSTIKDINVVKDLSDKPHKNASFLKTASIKLSSLRPSRKVKRVFIFIAIIVFLALAFFNLGKIISSKRRAHLTKESTLSSVSAKIEKTKAQIPRKDKVPTVTQKPKITEQTPKKEVPSGIRLSIRARENCWISLKADGKVVFQRVLEKGRFESWTAKEKIELSLGNAGAVELEVNGQMFSNLGRKSSRRCSGCKRRARRRRGYARRRCPS